MKKVFRYGDRVRVTLPGKRAFFGKVYSQYSQPGLMRRICVETPSGAGIAYPVMFVTHAKEKKP